VATQLRNTESGTHGGQRILRQQIGQALAVLTESPLLSDEAVHEVRKQLKKVRATLRLLREALGAKLYQQENAFFRDVARPFTAVRDAKVLITTLDHLTEHSNAQMHGLDVDRVRCALREHHQEVRQNLQEEDSLGAVRTALRTARARAKQWHLGRRGWSVLGAGLQRIYRSGRNAFATAQAHPSEDNLHEWRKQVKYLWHQLQVLQPLQPALIKGLADQAHALADALGDDHDLAVLHQKLVAEPDRFPDRATVNALTGLISHRRAELQEQAKALGRCLYEKKPTVFVDHLQGYWRKWRAEV
jgi:CHAD domain-containing protein